MCWHGFRGLTYRNGDWKGVDGQEEADSPRPSCRHEPREESFSFPGGSVTLSGRNIVMRSEVTPEDHARRVAEL